MLTTNYHTHCTYCDGKEPMKAFVEAAEKLLYSQLGFSSHSPLPFENNFSILEEDLPAYVNEIDELQKNTPVTLLKALECDFVPGMSKPFDFFRNEHHLDYIIGGVHLVKPTDREGIWFIDGPKRETYDEGLATLFDNNIRKAVTTFWEQTFEMLETQHMDIIAHFDKIVMHNQHRFFEDDELWFVTLADKALQLIKQHDVIIEINTRGLYKKRYDGFYPSTRLLMKARKMDIPVVISSDAHSSQDLGQFCPEGWAELQRCGYDHLAVFDPAAGCFQY